MSTFCVLPFTHFEITTSGHYRPCCIFDGEAKDPTGKKYNVVTDSLKDIQQSEWLHEIQQKMLNNEYVDGCFKCYNDEQYNNVSRRVRENTRFADEIENIREGTYNLRIIDIKPGNVCNLKCRICNEESSSQWMAEKRNWPEPHKLIVTSEQKLQFSWFENSEFWTQLQDQGKKLTHIEIFGGEPFLIKQQFEFLKSLIEQGVSQNISVTYATNGTVYPSDAIENIFPYFKDVVLMISADGVGDTFEYARYPATWSLFQNNLNRFVDAGLNITIAYSVSIYSIFNLIESLEYYRSKNIPVWLNTVYNENANIISLPNDLKKLLTNRIMSHDLSRFDSILQDKTVESFVGYMNDNTSSTGFDVFKSDVKLSDQYRQESILKVIPELAPYL